MHIFGLGGKKQPAENFTEQFRFFEGRSSVDSVGISPRSGTSHGLEVKRNAFNEAARHEETAETSGQ
ncbi:hypothetical protein QLX08_007943 [Tetragonisca angustula]|uniref:Uncharacterized protein n=1 Tax=Tetragonisca angustula TaxID=166442 RepID=A0AAW0ZQE4_9HYME